jgi:WD40 repeat protein
MIVHSLCLMLAPAVPSQTQDGAQPLVIAAKKHPGGNAESVAVSQDGKYVAAGFGGPTNGRFPLKPNGGGVAVWERESGKQVFALGEFGDVIKIAFSRDGRHLAYSRIYTPGDSIEADTTALIDLGSQKVVKRWSTAAFAFSPSDHLMVVAGRGGAQVIDLKTLNAVRTVAVRSPRALAFSADGRIAAALCYFWADNRGAPTGLAVFAPREEAPPVIVNDPSIRSACAVAVSPDGKQVVTGHAGGGARIWSTADPTEPQKKLTVDTTLALFPFFLKQGKTLVLAEQPANAVTWRYDQTDPSGFKFTAGKASPACDLHLFDFPAARAKGTWRFEDGSYRTHYARFGSARRYPEYNPARFAVSADGKVLIAGCDGCCAVDATTGKLIRTFVRSR